MRAARRLAVVASRPKSIGRESTFSQDTSDRRGARMLYSLAERAARNSARRLLAAA